MQMRMICNTDNAAIFVRVCR